MRRLVLILITLGVLAAAGLGVFWYLRQNTTAKLLSRSELALRGKQFERALELATAAVARDPESWRTHHQQGRTYIMLGRYDEARAALAEAAKHGPPGVVVDLSISETYAVPARMTLASAEAGLRPALLSEAVQQLRKANEHLAGVRAQDQAGALDIRQAQATNLMQIGFAEQRLADYHKRDALKAGTGGDAAREKSSERAATEAEAAEKKSSAEALAAFLGILREDPSRDTAAVYLVDLCARLDDRASLAEAARIVLAQESPPPRAAARLIMQELWVNARGSSASDMAKHLAAAAQKLDGLLEKHPRSIDAKAARAEVALSLDDHPKVQALCDGILDPKAEASHEQQFEARFLRARSLMAQNKYVDAEKELYTLRTERPMSATVQFYYARAADVTGKKELAREAMRTVTRLDPKHPVAAKYLADSLFDSGFAAEAFPDAKAAYEAHPEDPESVLLFVRAAKATDQPGQAQTALEEARKTYASRADMLLAVYEGYLLLGARDKALEAVRLAADCTAGNADERLAAAQADIVIGRNSEAQKLLTDELARNPRDARVAAGLAQLYAATGRLPQAIEKYREAVALDGRNLAYRKALANALYNYGLLDECEAEAGAILANNPLDPGAKWLSAQVRRIKGEISPEEMLQTVGGGIRETLTLAQECLRTGQLQKCIDICQKELEKNKDSVNFRSLLGYAYLAQGDRERCIEQLKTVLQQSPGQLPAYLQLADVLAGNSKPEEVKAALASVAGAKTESVELAMAWLFENQRQYDAAAAVYASLLARTDMPEDARNRARLFRAQALARAARADQAIAELDQLAATPALKSQALVGKASVLVGAGRPKEAEPILAGLTGPLVKDKNAALLERVCALYVQMRDTDKALAVCDQLEQMLPKEARPLVVRAGALASAGRMAEVAGCFQKAMEREPGNYGFYIQLARSLDADEKPLEALDALHKLAGLGRVARSIALFEEATILARWGLPLQSAGRCEELATLGQVDDTRLQLVLGQAFARLGRKDRAREVLEKIPEYAPQYVPARQTLADLEDRDEARLQILREVRRKKSGSLGPLIHEMGILLESGRAADAASTFREFAAARGPNDPIPEQVQRMAVQAMLTSDSVSEAVDLVVRTARETEDTRWRQMAELMTMDEKPDAAKALLPEAASAARVDALLGLVLAVQTGGDTAPWKGRLDDIQKMLSQMNPPRSLPAGERLLVAIASGAKTEADGLAQKLDDLSGVSREVAGELAASAAKDPNAALEAAQLIKVSVAFEMNLPTQGRAWAMKVLRARPTCQWAAAMAFQAPGETSQYQEILRILRPTDSSLAYTLQATQALADKQYDKAVEIARQAAEKEKGNPELLMNLALLLERAGRLAEALASYNQVYAINKNIVAANNAAYLTTQLYPKDTAKLAAAGKMLADALKGNPEVPAFLDTMGWVSYLCGDREQAVRQLRKVVKSIPDSPEVHFHLGSAEAAVGHKDLARWHFAAAVSLGEKLKGGKAGDAPPASLEAAKLAKEALAAMEQPKS